MIGDFLLFVIEMVALLWRNSHAMFFAVCALGVVLGGGAWWLAIWIAHNYNRQFSLYLQHHFYCTLVATTTVLFTLIFSAFSYTSLVVDQRVYNWQDFILADKEWCENTFRQAYEAVYELKDASETQLVDFTGFPHPDTGQPTEIPTKNIYDSKKPEQVIAQTYANGAVSHFQSYYPLFSKIYGVHPEPVEEVIFKDMDRVSGGSYMLAGAIQLASEQIRQELKEQAPRVIVISRSFLVCVFFLIQGVTIFLMIRVALRAIPEKLGTSRFVGA